MSDIAIKLDNVSKYYKLYDLPSDRLKEALHPFGKNYHKDFYATKNINLEIKKGEILGIVGKNGCGKSTLLKLISGVLTPNNGTILVNGKISALLELGAGFNPEFTGLQNIFFYGTVLGLSKQEVKGKLEDIIAFAEIGDFLYQPLKTYSSGMRARLAFSVAIHINPDILILDEVLSVGDALFQRKCYAKMEEFFKGGKTIIYVSHSISSINELCTRAILLEKGQLLLDGEPKVITSCYQKFLFSKENDLRKIFQEMESNKLVVEKPLKAIIKNVSEDGASHYIVGLVPKNTLEYKNENVEISEFKIETLKRRQVNVLITNEEYIYSFKVKFGLTIDGVAFGSQIINKKGMLISGASIYNIGESIDVKKNDTYLVSWKFTCKLLKGDYFFNTGVASKGDFLNRVTDALAFKVENKKNISRGIVSLDQEISHLNLNTQG